MLITHSGGYPSEDWYRLLQYRWEWNATPPFMVSGGFDQVLHHGLPLVPFGEAPVLPGPSRAVTAVENPLGGGLWSRGGWSLSTRSPEIPDSLLESGFTILQNTEFQSRYSVYLRRRLPGSILGGLSSSRGDSSGVSHIHLERGGLDTRGLFWNRGYSLQAGFRYRAARSAGGFSRLHPGDRRPWLISEISTLTGGFRFAAGAGTAWSDPDLLWRGAAMASAGAGPLIFSLHGDISESGHVVWGGLSLPGGAAAGVVLPDSGRTGAFLQATRKWGEMALRFNDVNRVAVSLAGPERLFRGMGAACWDFDRDSLALTAWALPGFDWYRARIEGGLRATAEKGWEEPWTGTLDALAGFTLRTFSFALALENITSDPGRSWTFGVTWSFTDDPPAIREDEEQRR